MTRGHEHSPAGPDAGLRLVVGGVGIGIAAHDQTQHDALASKYGQFISDAPARISIRIERGALDPGTMPTGDLVFDAGNTYRLYKNSETYLFAERDHCTDPPELFQTTRVSYDFRRVTVRRTLPDAGTDAGNDTAPDPLDYPLGEFLLTAYLATHQLGALLHGSAVADDGNGYVFLGHPGEGKSTMARLWHPHATVLCDERLAVWMREGQVLVYGTPWHSDFAQVSPGGALLSKIFFLRHGASNRATRVSGARAASLLIPRTLRLRWDAASLDFLMGFCERLVSDFPCYELEFVPNDSIVDFIRCVS